MSPGTPCPGPWTCAPPLPPPPQVFDECSEGHAVSAPAVLGVEALLQHVDVACSLRPYGYRWVLLRVPIVDLTSTGLWVLHLLNPCGFKVWCDRRRTCLRGGLSALESCCSHPPITGDEMQGSQPACMPGVVCVRGSLPSAASAPAGGPLFGLKSA